MAAARAPVSGGNLGTVSGVGHSMRHRAGTCALTLAVVALALAGCGGGSGRHAAPRSSGPSTSSTSGDATTSSTGPARPQPNPCIHSTPAGVRSYVGLTLAAAQGKARREGRTIRVVGQDGRCNLVTMDYSARRVDVYLVHGVVAAAEIG